MSVQSCDYSAYAVILEPQPHGELRASLYHWKHFDAEESTGVQLLHMEHIKPYPATTDPEKGQSWAKEQFTPTLNAISLMVPKNMKVAVCLWESAPVQDKLLRDEIERLCQVYDNNERPVTFQLVSQAGPFDKFLSALDSSQATLPTPHVEPTTTASNRYIAVYTVKPQNELRIYHQDSGSIFKLHHVEHFENEIDINEPEDSLKESVIDWVTAFLHPVLESETSAEADIQLYLPKEDLRADRENEYNSVREQIMNQLAVLSVGKTRIVLAGSSDPESASGILDPLLDVSKSEFWNRIKYLVTVKYDSNSVDIALERWEGSEGQGKGVKGEVVELFRAEPVTINLETDSYERINAGLREAIAIRNKDGGKNTTPLVLFLSTDSELDQARKPTRTEVRATYDQIWKVFRGPDTSMKYEIYVGLKVRQKSVPDLPGRGGHSSIVFDPIVNHVVVVDAGSGGTRAMLYRWQTYNSGPPTVIKPLGNQPFKQVWLPYIYYVNEQANNTTGIHLVPDAAAEAPEGQGPEVPPGLAAMNTYLDPLLVRMNALLVAAGTTSAATPMLMLATGGVRSIAPAAQEALRVRIIASTFFTSFQNPNYSVATGTQEALYGWITANYSLGRLHHRVALRTHGFVEMGGQSVQIAYEAAPLVVAGPGDAERKNLTITWNGSERVFGVFTKTFPNLGTRAARDQYFVRLQGAVGNVLDNQGRLLPIQDRCSRVGHNFQLPNGRGIAGSGLRAAGDVLPPDIVENVDLGRRRRIAKWDGAQLGQADQNQIIADRQARAARALAQNNLLAASVLPVFRLLGCVAGDCTPTARCGENCPARLLLGNPPINFNPLVPHGASIRFVGGASFWYAIRAIFTGTLRQEHSFRVKNIRDMIIAFANLPVVAGAAVNGHTLNALFTALLVYTTLYDGFGLPPGTTTPAAGNGNGVMGIDSFHPFNGVVGQNAATIRTMTPYSWTLGRAVYFAVGATGA